MLNFSQSRRKQNQHFRPLPKAPKSVNRRTQIFPVLPKANQKMRQSAKKSEKILKNLLTFSALMVKCMYQLKESTN
jgi:hypothetical protein